MTMVLNETLRLYPPAPRITIKAYKAMNLGQFSLLKGGIFSFSVLAMHHNEKFWGPDANLFKPNRFATRISKATIHPNAFFPFSLGPRSCLGQNFTMLEAKSVLAMILQRLTFSLSPAYKHAPVAVLTLQPQHGMQITFKSIEV
jgi:cytochrome P450